MVSVCLPSDASCNTYHLTWVSLILDLGEFQLYHLFFDNVQFTLTHRPNISDFSQHYSLLDWTLLSLPDTSTTGYCFCFGSIPSFFLELFHHWSPVAYWAPTDLGSSSFKSYHFCLFLLFTGLSRQEYWISLPFPSPVNHILSNLFIMTHPSWVAPHGMT